MYKSREELVAGEKFLKLNDDGNFVVDYPGELKIIDFHTHLSNLVPLKKMDPNRSGVSLTFPTLPALERFDLSRPYWTKYEEDDMTGLFSILKYSWDGYKILKAMATGGTLENCFKYQEENMINCNVLLPLSTKKKDLSEAALNVTEKYPDRFIPFCSVHPFDTNVKEKIYNYKERGAKGLKLKTTDMEYKDGVEALINLLKICYDANLPVIFHTGAITDLNKDEMTSLMKKIMYSTRVEFFGDLLKELPDDFTFIFGHSGIQEYKLVIDYMKKHKSTYTEVSTQSVDSIRYLIEEVGSDRIIFGTDWPALPQALTLSRVLLATEDSDGDRDNILYKNAEKILWG